MCGVLYAKNFKGRAVNNEILARFENQRTRGTRGFGFYLPGSDKLVHNPVERRIKSLLKRQKASEILFHHRQPTSTPNVRSSCHPFSTKNVFKKNYIVIHNGWITNDDELKAEHEALGIKYVSEMKVDDVVKFNDTEALSWELGRYLDGQITEMNLRGAWAFIAVAMDGKVPVAVHFGRDTSNPLKYKLTKAGLSIASEMEDKGSIACEINVLYSYFFKRNKLFQTQIAIKPYQYAGQIANRARSLIHSRRGVNSRTHTQTTIVVDPPKTDEDILLAMPKYVELEPKKSIYDNELMRLSINTNHDVVKMAEIAQADIIALNNFVHRYQKSRRHRKQIRLAQTRAAQLGHIKHRAQTGALPNHDQMAKIMSSEESAVWHTNRS